MNTEILGVAVQIVLMVVLAYPLGRYIARVVGIGPPDKREQSY